MITPGFGIGEFLTSFIVVVFNFAFPAAILFALYKIYIKLKNIEDHLKKN